MIKNKKLIALVCALSMIFTAFAGFTVVNAADTDVKGIVLEYDAEASTDTDKVLLAKYSGFDNIDAYGIAIKLPEKATATYELSSELKGLLESETKATAENDYTYQIGGMAMNPVSSSNKLIAKITVTLPAVTTKDTDFELTVGTTITNSNKTYSLELKEIPASKVTVPGFFDPDATVPPKPDATRPPRVTPEPVATVDPDATVEPTKTPVTVEKGIVLEYDAEASTDTEKVVLAKYKGFDNIDAYGVAIKLPEGATATYELSSELKGLLESETKATAENDYTYQIGGMAMNPVSSSNKLIAKIKITVPASVTSNFDIQLAVGTTITNSNKTYSLELKEIPADWVTIPVAGGSEVQPTPEPTPAGNVTVIDKIGAETLSSSLVSIPEVEVEKNGEKVSNYRVEISVTKDGKALDYGKDGFEFKIGDYSLTAAEYNNAILGGYVEDVKALGAKLGKTYNNLTDILADPDAKVAVYAAGATTNINLFRDKDTTKGDDEDAPDEIFVGGGSEEISSGTTRPTPGPKLTVKTKAGSKNETTSKTVTAVDGTTVKVTATCDKPVEGGMYKVAYDKEADKDYLALLTSDEVADGIFRFAVDKAGKSVKLTLSYVDGEKKIADETITIRTVAAGDDDDDDDSDSGSSGNKGGGSIAYPGSSVNNNNQGKIAFKDLDTVPWAEDAILALVDKKVVNGRSETIFDPNGTVTRAEFAKMVVLGFNLTGGTASNFTDVAAGDWFAPYVATGYNSGVISGYDDGTFRPNGLISRQEMAAMISRAIAAANKTAPATVEAVSFDDAWQIGSWAIDSVTTLQRAGIINGMTATTFEPLANATRAQAAVIINRAMTIAK